jgi:hypothetical protein
MKPTLAMLAALACLTAAPLAAHAQDAPGARILELLDQDGDDAISKAEVTAMREKMFARIDTNSDGMVDREEIEDARERIMEHASAAQSRLSIRFRHLDSDHNGGVTMAEFTSRTTFFDLADRNGDGKLSADEIARVKDMIGNLR